MEFITSIENAFANQYAKLPRLPHKATKWLATNSWWIVLIFAILGAISCLGLVAAVVAALAFHGNANIYGAGDSLTIARPLFTLVIGVATTILYFVAINPLKNLQKRGWNLLFIAQLLGILSSVVDVVVTLISTHAVLTIAATLIGFVIGLLFTAVWLYFVFQVRGEFGSRTANAVEAEVVEPADKK